MNAGSMLAFEKWEGLGNDFIVVNTGDVGELAPGLVSQLCDRRRGIGADGVLLVSSDPPRMVVFNADGSRPQMCGNGIRCVAAYLAIKNSLGPRLTIQSDAGPKACELHSITQAGAEVSVNMGQARILDELGLTLEGQTRRFLKVDMGNPHAVIFEPELEPEISVDRWGPEVSAAIVGGSNVEFCRIRAQERPVEIDVIVWERGVGRTQACGTGACAVAAAYLHKNPAHPDGEPICVKLPGGPLWMSTRDKAVFMRGPARCVFRGEVNLT